MKQFALFLGLLFTGCASASLVEEVKPHPQTTSVKQTLSTGGGNEVHFQAQVELSGKPHRLVLSVSRQFYRRYYKEEVVSDNAEMLYVFGSVRIEASLNRKGEHDLDQYPAHIILFHRRKDMAKRVLAEWWVTKNEVFSIRPENLTRPHLSVQSCERYLTTQ